MNQWIGGSGRTEANDPADSEAHSPPEPANSDGPSAPEPPFPEMRATSGAATDRAARLPANSEMSVRYVLGAGNTAPVNPADGPAPAADDGALSLYAELVRSHFSVHRPEPTSFPSMATRVIELADQPEADLAQLADFIAQDPAISIKVLQVANSALYHREFEIGSIKAAIGHMGTFAVANIAVGVACSSLFDADTRAEFDLYPKKWSSLFHQSMTVGCATSEFSIRTRKGRPDQVFLAGMFHDIGKTLALRSLCRLILEGRVPRLEEPQVDQVLEAAHVQVGTEAHAAWQLPPFLSFVCHHHHDDEVSSAGDNVELHAVRVVSGLNAVRVARDVDRRLTRQVRSSVHALCIDALALRELSGQIREVGDRVSQLFLVAA